MKTWTFLLLKKGGFPVVFFGNQSTFVMNFFLKNIKTQDENEKADPNSRLSYRL